MRNRTFLWLAAIAASEVVLFVWNCNHFFEGDSLFYFSNRVGSWGDVWERFSGPDHLSQYRPLTFLIFSYLLYPAFGLEPLGYNIVPLAFHIANTLLVYGILRRLLPGTRPAVLGAFFFGIHPTAFYVTYGVSFLPDFTYSLFYFTSILLFLQFEETGRKPRLALSVAAFILALSCKEAALTLAGVVAIIAVLHREGARLKGAQTSWSTRLVLRAGAVLPYVAVAVGYLSFHLAVKGGSLYAAGDGHPHAFEFSVYALRHKYKYLKWAANLPDGLLFDFQGWLNYIVAAALLVVLAPFSVWAVKALLQLDRRVWLGCLWFVAALSPVLFLRNLTMNHNLYVPAVGWALLMGLWLDRAARSLAQSGRARARLAIAYVAVVSAGATLFHNVGAVENSWIGKASVIAQRSLRDLQRQRPAIADGTALWIINRSSTENLQWYYDYGTLFRLFYPVRSMPVHFRNRVDEIPQAPASGNAIILMYDGQALRDITATRPNVD
jgi:hypothetical protein